MGCIASKTDINDIHCDTFNVVNIDEHGNKNFEATIRITEQELELYQKGKDTIVWPLKSLRRYGFETEVFTFESGRRGPTGPGIYAFRCQRAQQLFNLLQSYVRQTAPDHSTHANGAHAGRTNSIDEERLGATSSDVITHPYESQVHPHLDQTLNLTAGPHYINVMCPNNSSLPPLNLECPMPTVSPPSFPMPPQDHENGHDYVNVSITSPVHPISSTGGMDEGFSDFPRLPPKPSHSVAVPKAAVFGHITTTESFDNNTIVERQEVVPQSKIQLNYAQLDLNKNLPMSNGVPMENGEAVSNLINARRLNSENEASGESAPSSPQYAMIDFDRTNALNDVAKLQSQRSLEAGVVVGVRKTRHY